MTWISCKERLPEEFEECLVSDGKNVSAGYWDWKHDYFDKKKKDKCIVPNEYYKKEVFVDWNLLGNTLKSNAHFEYLVKYWMPFPEAPKKKRASLTTMNPIPDERKLVDWFKRDYFK